MAKLLITGIRIEHVWIGRDDSGKEKITASYRLVNDKGDTIGSKETLSTSTGYNETTFQPSAPTVAALKDAVGAYKKEVEQSIGLGE